jgi:hypothetical protein
MIFSCFTQEEQYEEETYEPEPQPQPVSQPPPEPKPDLPDVELNLINQREKDALGVDTEEIRRTTETNAEVTLRSSGVVDDELVEELPDEAEAQ